MKRIIGGLEIECIEGDITRQEGFDAVVNAANAQLRPGGGVAGAIHSAAGSGLYEECRSLAPIRPGEAVITRGYDLPNPHVIHCLGPVYGVDVPSEQLLADCYRNALRLAEEDGLVSVACPAISTGVFGYPAAEAAQVALDAVAETARSGSLASLRRIRFVLRGAPALRAHEQALRSLRE